MYTKPTLFCPVCDATLGYLTRNEVCSFVCHECKWIFTWGRDGKLKSPIKLIEDKKSGCGCESCKFREEQKILNNLKRT